MKKLINSLLMVILLCSCLPATDIYAEDRNSEEVVVDMFAYEKMKALYKERAILTKDWHTNEKRILEIDYEIQMLGAREISINELLGKLRADSVPYVDVIETDNIRWSSVRVNTNYNGQMLELQIIRACPIGVTSPLYGSTMEIKGTGTFADAASKNFLSVAVSSAAEAIPKVGGILSGMLTVKDAISTLMDGNVTTVNDFDCTYQYYLTSDEVFVFVKFQGSTDKYQEFCYKGNNVDFWCQYGVTRVVVDGMDSKPVHDSESITGYVQSTDYENCENAAAKNFFNYKLYGQSFKLDHYIYKVEVKTLDKTKVINVPRAELLYN